MKIKFTRKDNENGFEDFNAEGEYYNGFDNEDTTDSTGFDEADFSAAEEEAAPAPNPISLKIVNPKEYEKSKAAEMADFLMNGNTVLLNIESLESTQFVRYLDYLSGVIHAIGGKMDRVGKSIIVIAPKNVDVSGIESMVGSDD